MGLTHLNPFWSHLCVSVPLWFIDPFHLNRSPHSTNCEPVTLRAFLPLCVRCVLWVQALFLG